STLVPRRFERLFKFLESPLRYVGNKLFPVAEMPIGRRWTHAGPARRLRKGEACRAFLGNELECSPDKGLFQVPVMVAAWPGWACLPAPTHVKVIYMKPGSPSTFDQALTGYRKPALMAWRSGFGMGFARPLHTNATRTWASMSNSSPRRMRWCRVMDAPLTCSGSVSTSS